MGQVVTLPLFPDPEDHHAYVAVLELEWPNEGLAYRIVCPADGCQFMRWARFAAFEDALGYATGHRAQARAELRRHFDADG